MTIRTTLTTWAKTPRGAGIIDVVGGCAVMVGAMFAFAVLWAFAGGASDVIVKTSSFIIGEFCVILFYWRRGRIPWDEGFSVWLLCTMHVIVGAALQY